MNILPKKRWHVRTKDNIARVRRDEAEAAEKEKETLNRIEKADKEARLNALRLKAQLHQQQLQEKIEEPVECIPQEEISEIESRLQNKEHVNFFDSLEKGIIEHNKSNKDHDLEVKEEKEKYEKQIGYLTYLGQDTNESEGKTNWYNVLPERITGLPKSDCVRDQYVKLTLKDAEGKERKINHTAHGEVSWKSKQSLDPLTLIKKHVGKYRSFNTSAQSNQSSSSVDVSTKANSKIEYQSILSLNKSSDKLKKKKKKKHKHRHSSPVSVDHRQEVKKKKLQELRDQRLKREKEERIKTENLLSKLRGETVPKAQLEETPVNFNQRYNSQFNPGLAKQNYA